MVARHSNILTSSVLGLSRVSRVAGRGQELRLLHLQFRRRYKMVVFVCLHVCVLLCLILLCC